MQLQVLTVQGPAQIESPQLQLQLTAYAAQTATGQESGLDEQEGSLGRQRRKLGMPTLPLKSLEGLIQT